MGAHMKKARLGRGLDVLLDDTGPAHELEQSESKADGDKLRQIPVDMMHRGKYQPRTRMTEQALEELAESIKVQGIIQPILVRELATGEYEIIAGERRWRAAQRAGLELVPAVVRKINDETAMAVALIENIQREDLNPIEEAAGFQRLMDEFGMTHQEIADTVSRSRSAVSNLLRLLNLEPAVREMVEEQQLEMGHARALLALSGAAQTRLAAQVVEQALTVRQTEEQVRQSQDTTTTSRRSAASGSTGAGAGAKDPDVARLENELADKLGTTVQIRGSGKRGRLIISYSDLEQLEGILDHIQ